MIPSGEVLAYSALIMVGAYFVFGLTGFGSTVIALPLLVHVLPLKFAVPLLMLLDLAAFLGMGSRLRRGIRYDEIGWLVPTMLVGMALGLTLLIRVPEAPLLLTLGVFVIAVALFGLTRRESGLSLPRWSSAPIGIAGGAFSALFGTGGVLFALYNAARIRDAGELRASNAAMIALSALLRVVLFGATGLLSQDGLWSFALHLLPAMLVGMLLGHRLYLAVPARAVVRAVHVVLILAGVSLLARALA